MISRGEHQRNYGKLKNVELKLELFFYVDPIFMAKAETDIKQFMKLIGVHFEHEKYTELIIYDEIQLKHIRKQYEQIGQKYMGPVGISE